MNNYKTKVDNPSHPFYYIVKAEDLKVFHRETYIMLKSLSHLGYISASISGTMGISTTKSKQCVFAEVVIHLLKNKNTTIDDLNKIARLFSNVESREVVNYGSTNFTGILMWNINYIPLEAF